MSQEAAPLQVIARALAQGMSTTSVTNVHRLGHVQNTFDGTADGLAKAAATACPGDVHALLMLLANEDVFAALALNAVYTIVVVENGSALYTLTNTKEIWGRLEFDLSRVRLALLPWRLVGSRSSIEEPPMDSWKAMGCALALGLLAIVIVACVRPA